MKAIAVAIVLTLCAICANARPVNFFSKMLGKSPGEVQTRIDSVWEHFFTPADIARYDDEGEKSVYYECQDGTAFVMDTGNNDVRSEGMSYGMMISVQLDKREVFDKLWQWSKRHMAYAPSTAWDGYFCWQCRPDGRKIGGSNASDGELYFVTALYLAAERWKEPEYAREADEILEKVMTKNGEHTGVYNLFNSDNKLVTFVPDRMGHMFTDPSYQLPAFLDKWSRCAGSRREFWEEAATAARRHLADSADPCTGLYPDYSRYDGTAYRWPHAGYDTSIYMYDAIRCAMNCGMDFYLCGADTARQTDGMRRLLKFFKTDGFRHGHFTPDGKAAFGDYSRGMDGANAVGAVCLTQSADPADRELAREYLQRLWEAEPPTGKYRYYEG
ncbi:MAG: hypothetical protein K2F77_05395, partial [Muribaculaceae bacterium]|nr:hypothetical protein [Muribaculaceae bacterium]